MKILLLKLCILTEAWSIWPWKWFGRDDPVENYASEPQISKTQEIFRKLRPNRNSPTEEFIKFFGFDYEFHQITTDDGFNLAVHRIPKVGA